MPAQLELNTNVALFLLTANIVMFTFSVYSLKWIVHISTKLKHLHNMTSAILFIWNQEIFGGAGVGLTESLSSARIHSPMHAELYHLFYYKLTMMHFYTSLQITATNGQLLE